MILNFTAGSNQRFGRVCEMGGEARCEGAKSAGEPGLGRNRDGLSVAVQGKDPQRGVFQA